MIMKKKILRSLFLVLAIVMFVSGTAYADDSKGTDIGTSVDAMQVTVADGTGAVLRTNSTDVTESEYMPISDDFYDVPFITVTRASGVVENYSLNDLYPEGVPFSPDEWVKSLDASRATIIEDGSVYMIGSKKESYITEVEGIALSDSLSRGTRTFNWSIPANTIMYSTTQLSLSVYDEISYSFQFPVANSGSIGVGLWNNVNNTYINFDNISAAGGVFVATASGSWQMAVGGNFSFAIYNKNSYAISALGSYTY